MKKCLLLLSVFTSIYSLSNEEFFEQLEQVAKRSRDPQYLKFLLSQKRVEPKFYGPGALLGARDRAAEIHMRLKRALGTIVPNQDISEIGKSLDQELDAPIVNQCAIIDERRRKNGDFGTVQGKDPLAYFSGSYNGKIFFENACDCGIYEKLTDEQLEQLIQGTRPARQWFWPFN